MARLVTIGFEINTTAGGIEMQGGVGAATLGTTNARSGTYAMHVASLTSGANQQARVDLVSTRTQLFTRVYFYFVTFPSAENRIILTNNANNITTPLTYITIDNIGALRLYDEDSVIGSASSALSLNTWYRIEMRIDTSGAGGAHIVRARIDNVEFAGGAARNVSAPTLTMSVGGNLANEAQTTGEWWLDDWAINDPSGSFQTSFPGAGKIIVLRPSAAGDSNGFLAQVGGTAGAANNFTRVNENPPDDATSYNGSALLSAEDLFNMEDSGIGSGDIVNVVAVNVRMADLIGADATAAFKLEIEKTSGGTKAQSGTIIPNSTAWITNSLAGSISIPPLITYQDPDSANWTQATLDSMQAGYIQTATNVQSIAVSNVWVSVEYVSPGGNDWPILTGNKFWGWRYS